MEKYQIIANEVFFDVVISSLKDGGTYGWPNELEVFIKKDGKLLGSKQALDKVSEIVSEKYFKEKFSEQTQ